jgi:uncharacterized protein (TIGR02217 family)
MSTNILPFLAGLGFDVVRTPTWDTTIQANISGKEIRIANQTYPVWKWKLTYNVLRNYGGLAEAQELMGVLNARQGMFDSFLYQDADDNAVTAQQVSVGDGVTKNFQLIRTWGSFIEPVLSPNVVSHVYLNGVAQSPSSYTVTSWGTTDAAGPGVLEFNTAPASGAVITVDFSYYWPVRMTADSVDFNMFMQGMYGAKSWSFQSVKN